MGTKPDRRASRKGKGRGVGSGAPKSGRVRRWRRRLVLLLLLVLMLGAAGVALFAYYGLPRAQVIAKIEALTGASVDAGRIRLTTDLSTLVINDLSLRAPGVPGEAGRVLAVDRAEISLSRRSLLSGSARATRVRLFGPTIRISVDDQGGVNVAALAAARQRASAPSVPSVPSPSAFPQGISISLAMLPLIEVFNATVEAGEHVSGEAGSFRVLETLRVAGTIRPNHAEHRAEIDMYELSSRPGSQTVERDGLRISGEFDDASNRLTVDLTSIDLAEVDRLNPPEYIRGVWDRLGMSGKITRARLLIGPSEGVVADFGVDGIALTLPIDPAAPVAGSDSPMATPLRMSDVTGDIVFSSDGVRADLAGALNDFRAAVVLNLEGYSAIAPFDLNIRTTEPFRIAEQPDLLPYAPNVVKEISNRFGGPTGFVSAAVAVNRGMPVDGQAASMVTRGYLRITEGTGAFEAFPYPLLDVDASIRFEPGMVRLESVSARGPSGGEILAVGGIGPPGNEAGVDLQISASGVPLDDVFRETLASNGLDLMPVLFDEDGYARLRATGLVQTADEHAEVERQLSEARRSLDALRAVPGPGREREIERAEARVEELEVLAAVPVFELGGEASLDIDILRPVGADKPYTTDIVVRIREAGLLPAEFPYPIVGRRLGIHIRDNDARVFETPFVAAAGGSGTLSGSVRFELPDGDDPALIEPLVSFAARDVPIDPLLLFALPRGGFGEGSDVASFPEALARLGLSGLISCEATVMNATDVPGDQRLAVRAAIGIESLRADPVRDEEPGSASLLEDVSARITLDDRSFTVHRFAGRSGAGTISATGTGTLGVEADAQGTSIALELEATDLDLSKRLERLIVAFVPEASGEFARLRAAHLPEGIVSLSAGVSLEAAAMDYRVTISALRDAAFDVFGGRVRVENPSGGVTLTPEVAEFDDFSAVLREDAGHAARARLHGDFALRDGARTALEADIEDGRFESRLLRRWLETTAPDDAATLAEFELAGAFDAALSVQGVRGEAVPLDGRVSPRSVGITWEGHRFDFPRTSGSIGLGETGGSIMGLRGEAEDWSFGAQGVWSRGEGVGEDADGAATGGGLGLTLEVDVSGLGLPDDVLALLPPEARAALEELEFGIDAEGGGFSTEGARFIKEPAADGLVLFDGTVRMTGGRITPAVEISDVRAMLNVHAEKPGGTADAGVVIDADAEALRLFGLNFGSARTRVLVGTAAGPGGGVDLPTIDIRGFDGLVTGRAAFPEFEVVDGVAMTGDGPPRFALDLRMTGLDLGGVLDDAALTEARESGEPGAMPGPVMTGRRGTIDGSVFLTGRLEQPLTHRGRGELLVEGGDILNIPGVVALVKLANLMPGPDEPFSVASAAFSMRHDRIQFDRIVFEAPRSGTKLLGVGWMSVPGTELEMIFTPQAGRQVPLLSELFAGLRDEVARPYVSGTLRDPVVELRQLSRVRGMLGTIFATRSPELPAVPAAVNRPE